MNTNAQRMTPEDDALLAQLYTKYHSQIYLYVNSYIKDECISNDITADVFTLACERFDEFKAHPNQGGWLYQTAKNKIREFYRKIKKDPMAFHKTVDEEDEAAGLHNHPSYCTSQYSLKELEASVYASLSSAEYKRFLRYFIWGYSLQEMADMEGVSYKNMAVRLTRLRQKLQERLQI